MSTNGWRLDVPAFATRQSSRPKRSRVERIAATTCSSEVTSHSTPNAEPPSSSSSRTAAELRSARRDQTATDPPARAIPRAMPRPIPELPPVTTATRPDRSITGELMGPRLTVPERVPHYPGQLGHNRRVARAERSTEPAGRAPEEAIRAVAAALVASGRVVPALAADNATGRYRSWWWPLPSAAQRSLIAPLLRAAPPGEGHALVAAALAEQTDSLVRDRLVDAGASIAGRRSGRPTVPEAWARSLVSADPWLPDWVDRAKLAALAARVGAWVRSGAVVGGRARLCLRVREPARPRGEWAVELLAQDNDEPSLVVPLRDMWTGGSPFAEGAMHDLLAALARTARLAPELAGVLDAEVPDRVALDDRAVLTLLRERAAPLEDAGIAVLLPSWWSAPTRLGLRARARSSSSTSGVTSGRLGLDVLVDFEWEAALGGRRLTKADLAVLVRAAAAKQELVRLRGEWVEVRPDRIEALLDRIGRTGTAPAGELMRAALGLGNLSLPDGLDVAGVDARGVRWLDALLDDAVHLTAAPVPTPDGFEGRLRPYQERGVGWMAFLGRLGLGACLADDMGLGKTAQLIASILADRQARPTLVVCPVSVLGNWEAELRRFAPGLKVLVHHGAGRHSARGSFAKRARAHDVVLTTYSLLARDQEHLGALSWARVVFDEAQQVKNPSAAQTKAAYRLKADRRVALTGTPVENRLSELWSIMNAVNPGLLGSARSFRERFAVPIEREHDPEATELLRKVTGPFVLRRLKTDRSVIADLPDKIETVDRCPLTREQATLYRAVVDDMLAQADEAEGIERRGVVLAGLLKLKQVCNHPAHFLGDGSTLAGRSGKLTRVEELLEEIVSEGDKVLCFTQFAAWGDRLLPYLEHRLGVDGLWLHGKVPRAKRDEMVRRFSEPDGPPLFLVSLKAGGTGLNLTAASHVVHFDRWWNPAVEDQATDRAYRIGQHRTVQVHKLVSSGTVEERIDEMITSKRRLAARVVGTGEDWLTELSTAELRQLVSLAPGVS